MSTFPTSAPTAGEALFASLGIQEVEANVCEDTFPNRRLLRKAGVVFRVIPPEPGTTAPTALLEIDLSPDARGKADQSSWERNKWILTNPKDPWSDYVPLDECPLDFWETAPAWLIRVLRSYEDAVKAGIPEKDRPILPVRCKKRRGDGTRCWAWSWTSNPHQRTDICRSHGPNGAWNRAEEIQRLQESARLRLAQLTDDAIDVMDELMHESKVDQVRARMATELLDRAGLKPGTELTISGDVKHTHEIDPAQAVRDRLRTLAERITPKELEASDPDDEDCTILEAEIVEDSEQIEVVDN